jgi:hypothetical protein
MHSSLLLPRLFLSLYICLFLLARSLAETVSLDLPIEWRHRTSCEQTVDRMHSTLLLPLSVMSLCLSLRYPAAD